VILHTNILTNQTFFLANLMKFFPSLYGKRVRESINNLIEPTFNNSVEFCKSFKSGIISSKFFNQGGNY